MTRLNQIKNNKRREMIREKVEEIERFLRQANRALDSDDCDAAMKYLWALEKLGECIALAAAIEATMED